MKNEQTNSFKKNTLFYLIYNLLNVIFPFVTGIYVAHILLPTSIGNVEAAKNLAQYFVIFAYLGIPTYGLREISKYRNNKNELNKLYSELIIINLFSTIFFLLIYLTIILLNPLYRQFLPLYLITGISIALNVLNNSWLYEGLEKFDFISIRNLIFKIISFILLLLLVTTEDDYLWYAAITVIGTAGNYILNIINSKKYVSFSFKNLNLKRHLHSIFFLVVVNLAIEIYSLVDITMLNIFCTNDHIAYYSYGSKIQKILVQIINTFTVVIVPKLALYYKEGKSKDLNELLTNTFKIIIILAIPIVIGIYFISDYFITLIYGSNYITSSTVLKILSIIIILSPIGYLLGSRMLLISGKENLMIIPVGIGAILNVILNYFFIQKWSEIGASIASVISEATVMIIYIILGHNEYKLSNFVPTLIKEGFSLILMTGFLYLITYFFDNNIFYNIIKIFGAILIYFTNLLVMKEETILKLIRR